MALPSGAARVANTTVAITAARSNAFGQPATLDNTIKNISEIKELFLRVQVEANLKYLELERLAGTRWCYWYR